MDLEKGLQYGMYAAAAGVAGYFLYKASAPPPPPDDGSGTTTTTRGSVLGNWQGFAIDNKLYGYPGKRFHYKCDPNTGKVSGPFDQNGEPNSLAKFFMI